MQALSEGESVPVELTDGSIARVHIVELSSGRGKIVMTDLNEVEVTG